jgi:transposase
MRGTGTASRFSQQERLQRCARHRRFNACQQYRPVWVKSPEAQRQGRLLTARATLQSQLVALENTIRGLLRQERTNRQANRIRGGSPRGERRRSPAASCVTSLLETRNAVLEHRTALDRQILRIVRADAVCRLLMTAPGVGALVSLAFKVAVDDPRRFSRSRDVGAHFGLTPREHSSGELNYGGRISQMVFARFGGCSISQPAACCGTMQRYGARSKSGLYASPSALASARIALAPQTRGRATRHVERWAGIPVAAL